MRLIARQARVRQAEQALQAHYGQTLTQARQLGACWRANLTPGRVIVAGLALGFLVGRARPLQWAGGGGALAMLQALSQLVAQAQVQLRAAGAGPAAHSQAAAE